MKIGFVQSFRILPTCLCFGYFISCAPAPVYRIEKPVKNKTHLQIYSETGIASYYGNEFAGRKTANGEKFDPEAMTAAHRTLPFGTKVRVINLSNRRSVDVRINDRGPFVKDRIIDLSLAAARKLDIIQSGTARVTITIIESTP